MWFKLSGRWKRFRWVGNQMVLRTSPPFSMVLTISEGEGTQEVPNQVTEGLVELLHEADVSDELRNQADGSEGTRLLESFSVEPHNIQGEIRTIQSRMASELVRVLNVVRWTVGAPGPANPVPNRTFSYSLDGSSWIEVHAFPILRRAVGLAYGNHDTWREEVQHILDRGSSEPVGHGLFRAAWEARIDNPRASLVLGVAALEVGTKDCISRLVPDATWLVDNMPAPPVVELIRKYLPTLLKERGNLLVFAPPKEHVQRIRQVVEHRNTLAHKLPISERYLALAPALEYLELEESLKTIEDLLWLFDVYCDRPRALQSVRHITLDLMARSQGLSGLPQISYIST